MHFGRDFGAKIGKKKTIQKRCQKHVGIDLEVEPAENTKNDTPHSVFGVFSNQAGSKIH